MSKSMGLFDHSAGFGNETGSQIVLEGGRNQESHIPDDVTRAFAFRPADATDGDIPYNSTGTRR